MPENGQSEKKRELIPYQNGSKLVGRWIKCESENSVSTKATSVFKDLEIAETLSTIYDKYGVVPADKVPNNKHYIDCLNIVLGLYSSQANPT